MGLFDILETSILIGAIGFGCLLYLFTPPVPVILPYELPPQTKHDDKDNKDEKYMDVQTCAGCGNLAQCTYDHRKGEPYGHFFCSKC